MAAGHIADIGEVDLAGDLVALAKAMDALAECARRHAAALIVGWASPESADALAEVLDDTAQLVRLHRQTIIVDST